MKTIYFVRHGESEANIQNLRSGSMRKIPVYLTERGRQQAKKAGESLGNKNIDLIVSSPLIRTEETAKIIAKAIGYDPKKIVLNPCFIERDFGIYDGKADDVYLTAKAANKLHKSVETTEALHKRIAQGLEWLKEQEAEQIVLVSHGAAGRSVQALNQELEHNQMHTMKLLDNAEIYEFNL
jgi:broad specificity phosphatase PhoE